MESRSTSPCFRHVQSFQGATITLSIGFGVLALLWAYKQLAEAVEGVTERVSAVP